MNVIGGQLLSHLMEYLTEKIGVVFYTSFYEEGRCPVHLRAPDFLWNACIHNIGSGKEELKVAP